MYYPGNWDEELMAADPVMLSRERELSFLLSPAFLEILDRKGPARRGIPMPFARSGSSKEEIWP
jgi:hypothetical protein